jgi:hypothetical protein
MRAPALALKFESAFLRDTAVECSRRGSCCLLFVDFSSVGYFTETRIELNLFIGLWMHDGWDDKTTTKSSPRSFVHSSRSDLRKHHGVMNGKICYFFFLELFFVFSSFFCETHQKTLKKVVVKFLSIGD